MIRRPVVVANWKMYLSHKGALETLEALRKLLQGVAVSSDVVICPSYPTLPAAQAKIERSAKLQLGGQSIHWEEKGAWTGAVSVLQLRDFVTWCIIGHSEARGQHQLTDEQVSTQAGLLIKHGLTPIVCLGETAEERAADETHHKITRQVQALFKNMPRSSVPKVVVAYEPIWAISSNIATTPPDAGDAAATMLLIRKICAAQFDVATAERLRVLYGGSVTTDNVGSYLAEPGVDGVVVGRASLQPAKFVSIIKAVQRGRS